MGNVASSFDAPIPVGRRRHARLRLCLPAQVITLTGRLAVEIVDMSQSGAAIACAKPIAPGADVVLTWGDHEAFGTVRWSDQWHCGIDFDEPLPERVILATREMQRPPDEHQRAIDAAKVWVAGKGRFGFGG